MHQVFQVLTVSPLQMQAEHEKEIIELVSHQKEVQEEATAYQEKLRLQLDSMKRQLKQVT
jgi:hypothetical protein